MDQEINHSFTHLETNLDMNLNLLENEKVNEKVNETHPSNTQGITNTLLSINDNVVPQEPIKKKRSKKKRSYKSLIRDLTKPQLNQDERKSQDKKYLIENTGGGMFRKMEKI